MFNEVLLAFGGNISSEIGSSTQIIFKATHDVAEFGLEVVKASRFFNTPGFPAGIGPDYINAVVLCRTEQDPNTVLESLHQIELKYGRTRDVRWGSRTLDIDLIAVGDLVLPDTETYQKWFELSPKAQKTKAPEQLILPHPRVQDRAFVLVPMCDVAPDWVHPVTGLTTTEMLAMLPADEIASVVPVSAS
ncbi:MAG: 2-amino-4-hydroxy-6-hydroxymethyldihydropteridine diphosphokinase [Paracoccaceae bacterium]